MANERLGIIGNNRDKEGSRKYLAIYSLYSFLILIFVIIFQFITQKDIVSTTLMFSS